ncbi:glycosyltransferase family 4 protein [Myroides marinus]|uniref:glycosyltransferase family 4 protein n=1 Tax=Myroides marinus TaxID=703342 RepID=UPI002578DCDF|nr:glycosyltransferase family 4 protein [Myroides marinus]MDM1380709.1 glycosyltransferase family 4 protein [Myroides marinus]MDM1387977.1 glycosyltransferase family 4 protein [Myroides marinus]MDM1395193.1 glycosyltransferase family 4 protein [Myroides marinus]
MKNVKVVRTSTIPLSLNILLKGQLSFLKEKFDIVGISSNNDDLKEVAYREGIHTIAVDMERSIAPFRDIISLIKLVKIFKREKPLIVHSITPKAGLLTMLAGKMAGVPIRMHTFTGLIFPTRTGLMQKLLIKMDQLLCWSATNIYPEGNGVKNDLMSFRITNKPLKVLANGNVNGIDLKYYSSTSVVNDEVNRLKEDLEIHQDSFIFVFVGRLVGDKGINELVHAFDKIQKTIDKSIKLLLVGSLEAELDPLLNSTLNIINSNKDIISVGFQKDVRPYFAISDALVFPSYREGFPNVVMQAGAMELPSIVSDINGCNEIIVEGVNGTIIPVKNTEAIRAAMFKFLNDKDYYHKLKKNSRQMITERYEQHVVWNALLEEYNTLIAQYEKSKKK